MLVEWCRELRRAPRDEARASSSLVRQIADSRLEFAPLPRLVSTSRTRASLHTRSCLVAWRTSELGHVFSFDTLPFYFLGVLPSISALCAMSNSAKKKTTAMREVRAPQPGAAHQCRRLLFDWPLPRTHAHIFACRWLGACMPPPTPPAEVQQSPGVLLQQQNGPSVCFPNAGYRVISTCADPNRPVQRES